MVKFTSCAVTLLTVNTTSTNVLCKGQCAGTATANPSGGSGTYTYSWNTNPLQTTQTAIGLCAGTYSVTVTNSIGNSAKATVTITQPTAPFVNLGNDTSLCQGETITLDAENTGAAYLWSSGDTSKNFVVSTTGIYWVIVRNYLCESSDSINISYSDCEVLITMPNVFTPNGDGKNDRYLPIIYKGILKANIKIYNRWGDLVHQSDKLLDGWDGKNNGIICADGTYYWIVDYTDVLNNHNLLNGFFTLLK